MNFKTKFGLKSTTCNPVSIPQFDMHSNIVALYNMFHILHVYKLNMKNVSISLSTMTYKRHINIVVCTQYDDLCAVPLTVKCFYLIKIFFLQRKCIMSKVSYS